MRPASPYGMNGDGEMQDSVCVWVVVTSPLWFYVLARIACAAFFHAKLNYQVKLMKQLKTEEH